MDFLLSLIGKSGMTQAQASSFIKTFKQTMLDELAAGREIVLPGVGKFKVVDKDERKGRNPLTGEALTIKAHKAVKFVPSQTLKAKVN